VTVVAVSDNFNRSDEALNKSGGNWVGQSKTAVNVKGNLAECVAGSAAGHCQHMASYIGPQQVELTITELGASGRARLLCGVQNHTTLPGSTFNIYASGQPTFYRFGAHGGVYQLVQKVVASSGNTDIYTVPSLTPANGHKIKMTWNPTTRALECFVDSGSGFVSVYSATMDASAAPADTNTRLGFHIEDGAKIDNWTGTWTVADGGGGGGSGGWEFSEWQGGTSPTGSEVSLTVDGEWAGGTAPTGAIVDVDVAATSEYPTDNTGSLQPIWSELIRNGTGINCHYKFSNNSSNVHSKYAQCTSYILEMNVGWVRDRLNVESTSGSYPIQISQAAILQAANIGNHWSAALETGSWENTGQTEITSYFDTVTDHPTWKITLAGPNEPNDGRVTGWVNAVISILSKLKATRDSRSPGTPIVGPGLMDGISTLPQDFTALGNAGAAQYVDYGDYHRYPLFQVQSAGDPSWQDYQPDALERTPEYLQQMRIDRATAAYNKNTNELFVTEGGFATNLNVTVGPKKLPEDVHGIYAERLIMSLLTPRRWNGLGVKRFFLFELLDDPDPDENLTAAHWGQVFTPSLDTSTWSRKQSFNRIKALMAKVSDNADLAYDPDVNPFIPPKINMDVVCTDSRFRYCVTAKRNGEVRLFYWLDKALWRFDADLPGEGEYITNVAGEQTYTKIGELPTANYPGGQNIDGLSGSSESRQHTNAMWLHMERPNSYMWLVDSRNLAHKKTVRILNPSPSTSVFPDGQWEDCAYDVNRGKMWIAHCGANTGQAQFDAALFTEPVTLGSAATVLDVNADAIYKFGYDTGASTWYSTGLDCECMMVNSAGRVFFVDKRATGADGGPVKTTLWRAPSSLAAYPAVNTLTAVAVLGADVGAEIGRVSRGDWNHTDNTFVVADNFNDQLNTKPAAGEDPRTWVGHKFDGTTFAFIETVQLPVARKISAESNTNANPTNENFHFTADGLAGFVGTEGTPPTEIWRTDFPTGAVAGSAVTVTTDGSVLSLTATPTLQDVVIESA